MQPGLPDNEAERLRGLHETGLLDSLPEEDFDSLVQLAAAICDTPIALVSLIDSNRQWFKANVGFNASETDRNAAFCAYTILQGDPFIVSNALKDDRFAQNPLVVGDPGIRFYAGVPFESEDGLRFGSLCVIDRTARSLSEKQLEALCLLALQANKQINLRRQQRQLQSAVVENDFVARELRAGPTLFHAFMDNAPLLAFMKDSQGKMAYYNLGCAQHFKVGREEWLGKADEELWPLDIATALRANDRAVLREWKTTVVEERVDARPGLPEHWRSYKFPFRDSEGREYVAGFAVDLTADKESAERIASYQSALETANEKLLKLSVTDDLTKILNRRAFDAAIEYEFVAGRRYEHTLSLLMVDIDDFKLFNDTFGHEMGDQVLQAVAGVTQKSFRGTDTVARYGGEEFAILLPNTTRQSAVESAERLRSALRDLEFGEHRIKVSIGAASTAQAGAQTQAELVRRADDALYRAKRGGKDRICIG